MCIFVVFVHLSGLSVDLNGSQQRLYVRSGYNAVVDAIHLFGTGMFPYSVMNNEHLAYGILSADAGQVQCHRTRYMEGNLAINLDLIWGTLVEGLPLGLRLLLGAC